MTLRGLLLALMAFALPLAGCLGDDPPALRDEQGVMPSEPEAPSVQHFSQMYNLTATRHIPGPGHVDGALYGLVLRDYTCAFIVVKREGPSFHILRGNATLEWSNQDVQLHYFIWAEKGEARLETAAAPSPSLVEFGDIRVDFNSWLQIAPRISDPLPEMRVPVHMRVEFEYMAEDGLKDEDILAPPGWTCGIGEEDPILPP